MRRVSSAIIALTLLGLGFPSCEHQRAYADEQNDGEAAKRSPRAAPRNRITPEMRAAFIAAAAKGIPAGDADKTLSPYFFVLGADREEEQLPLEKTDVRIDVASVIANVRVTQVYRNRGAGVLEAIYVFPASTRAAVHAMRMTVGERVIEADVRKRQEARRVYEKARDQGQTASLLEEQRPNVLQMNVANILPGDEIRVELSYTELLVPEERAYELVFPTVVGPRYSHMPQEAARQQDSFVESPYLHQGEKDPAGLAIRASIRGATPLAWISSPSHRIDVGYPSPREALIGLFDGEDRKRRDFVLRFGLAGDRIESGLLLEQGEKERYFVLTLEPPARNAPEEVLRREYVFIVDVSGSMHGFPLDTSKALLRRMLGDLRPTDAFNVLLFSGGSAVLSESSLPATPDNIARGMAFIDAEQGGGGTELLPALKRAFGLPRVPGGSRLVVVATDGYVDVEDEAFALTRRELGQANLFAFGIGGSVNRELIESLARAGRGEPFLVLEPEQAEAVSEKFARYVSAPLLTGIQARFEGVEAFDLEPERLPDLLAERPIVLTGKLRGAAEGRIVISGATPSGSWSEAVDVLPGRAAPADEALRLYWARERIRSLADRHRVTPSDALEKSITDLGLAHHLLTQFTSFVAVDQVVRADGKRIKTVRQPLAMPNGVSDLAVGDSFGYGGLGLRGTGRGGGGTGVGTIGLGHIGTIGYGAGAGYGRSAGGLGGRTASVPSIRSGAAVVQGALSKEVIRRIVHRHINEVRSCYEGGLARNPSLSGRVVVKLVVSPEGAVQTSAVERSTLGDAQVETCIADAIRRWIFPKVEGGGIVVVTYPFQLAPGK